MAKANKGSKNVDPQIQKPNEEAIEVAANSSEQSNQPASTEKKGFKSAFKALYSAKYFPLVSVLIGFAFIGSYWVLFSNAASVNGLTGTYFKTINLSGAGTNRVDPTINFNWGTSAPIAGFPTDNFSIRWTGQVKAPQTGAYKFITASNDGVRLWVNNQLVIDNWTNHTVQTNTGTISLTANSYYDIKVEYYESTNTSQISLSWTRPDGKTEIVPSGALFSTVQQPSAPQNVTTAPGDKAVTMTWKVPASTGSSAITGYRVTRITGDTVAPNPWTSVMPATASSITFTYLQNGTSYQFSVAAINSSGEGPATIVSATPQAGAVASPTTGSSIVTVTSPFTVTSNPYNQDTEYRVTSSLRQNGATNPLPFDMPARATLAASPKKAVAHYFPQFPISVDNADPANDWYATRWLTATGEGGKHVAYGGYLRDRPLPRAPISGDWQLADVTTESKWARDAGLDGFLVDTLSWSTTNANYTRGRKIFDGAKNLGDSTFKVAYMVDTDIVSGTDYATAAARIADAYKSGSYMMINGKLVVSAYRPEGNSTPSFWQNIDSTLKNTYKLPGMIFIPCYSSNWNAHTSFDSFTYAMGIWTIGNTPGANSANWNNTAKSLGKLFMQPIAFGDSRPRGGVFDEQQGLLTLRDQWLTAIANNVDWVQYRTWSDFSEGAQMIPSRNHGYSYLDVSAYYLTRWKTGSYPAIKRDALYISHRISTWNNKNTQVAQSVWQVPRSSSQPGQNIVDVMSFLTAPGTVTVKVGSNTYSYAAPAGVYNKQLPLANGTVSASLSR